jgi:hypothetical protein
MLGCVDRFCNNTDTPLRRDARTRRSERIGIIPIGYADGYRRVEGQEVLVRGQRAPGELAQKRVAKHVAVSGARAKKTFKK